MKQQTISSVLLSPLSTLLILCVAILSQLTFVSCKDEELTEEERQQKQEQENNEQFLLTSEFWQVVGQLSNAEVLPDDWQNATFEPGIGEASDKSATTRIVPTNDASAAAESFEHLTGVDVSNLIAYEWTRDFGTLTYHRLNDGTGWAAVDVDIKQMPGLKRIVYCTPEQQGLNAKVPGVPYYRFGDVIKKKNENEKWEYWVCVRPCFGPEEKGDMHWMCLGNLPDKNIKSYTYTKQNRTWYWPTGLTTNYEHIKNLSEMTSAILYPEQWANYYESHQNKKLFHDFSYANIKYHNRYFWKLVQDAWNTPVPSEGGKTVFELLFHRDRGQMENSKKLNYFYGSASGPGTFSWYMNLNLISVSIHLSEGFKCRDLDKLTSNKSCEKKEFDIREYSEKGYSTKARDSSFIEPGAYVYPLRYATGKQLFGSQPGYYQSMGGSNNIEDVYVFNERYHQQKGSGATMTVFDETAVDSIRNANKEEEPIVVKSKLMDEVSKDDIGKVVGKDGKIYDNVTDAQKAGTKALAMVAAIARTDFKVDDIADESKSKQWEYTKNYIKHAIALALEDGPLTYDFPDHDGNSAFTVKGYNNDCTKWAEDNSIKGAMWCFLNSYYYQRMIMDCGAEIPSIYTLKAIEKRIENGDPFNGMPLDSKNLIDKMEACGDNARIYVEGSEWLYSLSDNKIEYKDRTTRFFLFADSRNKKTYFRPDLDFDILRTRNVLVW